MQQHDDSVMADGRRDGWKGGKMEAWTDKRMEGGMKWLKHFQSHVQTRILFPSILFALPCPVVPGWKQRGGGGSREAAATGGGGEREEEEGGE